MLFQQRLTPEEALELLRSDDLPQLGFAANQCCAEWHPGNERTYFLERNINYTNGCISGCQFCAFCRSQDSPEHYILDQKTLFGKIEETVALGGAQILLQGGLHPSLPFSWYLDMLRGIKTHFPQVNIHGFSPTEIVFFADHFGMSLTDVLRELRNAGLGSLPGGGAEILVDRIRQQLSPKKATADRWIEVCRIWHQMGGKGSATMMFGHLETLEDRVEHLQRIRALQDETGGFTSFICWTFQPGNTTLSHLPKSGSWDYLKTLAVSRLFLDNIPTIQASWITQGLRIGGLALHFGANDLGSVMIEENVVAAAGTVFRTTEQELQQVIQSVGFTPKRRAEVLP